MKERIIEFLRAENKTSAQLAEEIGVQPSGISHILSGRNNPSLDFVLKMLEKYSYLSSDWLLFGRGVMYKDIQMQTLFDEAALFDTKNSGKQPEIPSVQDNSAYASLLEGKADKTQESFSGPGDSTVRKIVWFYNDGTFIEYHPVK